MEFVLPLVILSWRRWRLQDWERSLVIFALEAISAFYFYTRISNGFLFFFFVLGNVKHLPLIILFSLKKLIFIIKR
jgi:hypothetical protein